MNTKFYLPALTELSKEIKDNYDMIIKINSLDKTPPPEKSLVSTWPKPVLDYFHEMNGARIHWQHDNFKDKPNVTGKVNLQSADKVAADGKGLIWFDHTPAKSNLRNFRIIDFFVDEAAVGFYDMKGSNGEMHLYLFEGEPEPLGVDFKGYIQLLCQARGFFYWQNVLLAFRKKKENQESKDFRTYMPQIFPEFNFSKFEAKYKSLKI